jgi:hypothetical protein
MVPGAADTRVKQVCSSQPCTGKFSRVTPFLRAGRPVIYMYEGDLATCSHPPSIYVDETGKTVLAQGNHPVTKEQAAPLQAEREAVLAGLVAGKSVACGDAP